MLLSFLLSPPLLAQQITDTGWKVINKDVYKKDTSGSVVIGNMNPADVTEKLNVQGTVRLDGLRGNFDRDAYIDRNGVLRADQIERIEGGGGPPDWLIPHVGNGGNGGIGSNTVNKEHCGITGGCMIGIGTDNPQKKLHIFTDHTVVNPDIPGEIAEEEPIVEEPIFRGPKELPERHSHYGIRLDDRTNNSDSYRQIWDLEPIAELRGFFIRRVDPYFKKKYMYMKFDQSGTGNYGQKITIYGDMEVISKVTFNNDLLVKNNFEVKKNATVKGDLNVTGNINTSSSLGINFTSNVATTGYLKSGNSIIIDGGTTGDNHDNVIYTTTGTMSLVNGTPDATSGFSGVQIGIGTKTPAKALHIYTEHFESTIGTSHYGIRLEDHYTNQYYGQSTFSNNEVWDLEPIGKDGNFSISTYVSGAKKTLMTFEKSGKTKIFGDLEVTGKLNYTSMGLDITGNISSSGYIKSGNSIIIDGGTLGDNTDNTIYSTTGTLYLGNGYPNNPNNQTDFNNIKIGIGTKNLRSELTVDGVITTRKVITTSQGWGDYIFDKNYKLKTVDEVKEFISKNKHLEGVPTECEVAENGVDLGEMIATLLKLNEEMYLHIINMNEEIKKLKSEKR